MRQGEILKSKKKKPKKTKKNQKTKQKTECAPVALLSQCVQKQDLKTYLSNSEYLIKS